MSIQIQTPNITAADDRQRLQQIQSYLYRMAGQLQWAFDHLQAGTLPVSASQPARNAGKQAGAKEDPVSTFAALKNLIIKSADIVNAYYDEISSRLEGLYVAQSDFGIYAQETQLEIRGNSEGIDQLYSNEQTILTHIQGLRSGAGTLSGRVDTLAAGAGSLSQRVEGLASENRDLADSLSQLYAQSLLTNAYIKTGLISYDSSGAPVYGLEIGQTNSVDGETVFDKFARFSSDRLSFFDSNDVEVAYISDYKLYITNAEISGTLYLSGKFKIYYNGGLAFQWTGGET